MAMNIPIAVWSIACFWAGVTCAWIASRWSR